MKRIPGIILLILFVAEFIVFLTDFEFSFSDYIFEINAVLIVVLSIYIAYIIKATWLKIFLAFLSFLIGSTVLGLFFFNTTFSCKDRVELFWEIEGYELVRADRLCWGGLPSQKFYKLNKKYVFGLLKKPVEIIAIERTEAPKCIITFKNTGFTFDTCEGELVNPEK